MMAWCLGSGLRGRRQFCTTSQGRTAQLRQMPWFAMLPAISMDWRLSVVI